VDVRVQAYCQRSALICDSDDPAAETDLWDTDKLLQNPTALTSALKAIELARNELRTLKPHQKELREQMEVHMGLGQGSAGMVHFKLGLHHFKKNTAAAELHFTKAKEFLRQSLENCTNIKFEKSGKVVTPLANMESHETSSWKWSFALAVIRNFDANQAKGLRNRQAFAEAQSDGCKLYGFTVANCPVGRKERGEARDQWQKLNQQKF
jgi:hypothetical protein